MTDTKIHLVDDDEAILHSASFMLRHAGYRVHTYASGEIFLDAIAPEDTGCVLLDVRMPGLSGLEVQRELQQRGITLPVIILTGHGEVSMAVQAMKDGAVDFLEKPYEKARLIAAITDALEKEQNSEHRERETRESQALLQRLSKREYEVLEGLVQGLTNKRIAETLNISSRTVEIHRSHVMEKLGTESLSATLKIAFRAGLH